MKQFKSFDAVTEQLIALNKNNVSKKMLFDLLEEFTSLAYEESLDMVADQFGLELQTSDYFASSSNSTMRLLCLPLLVRQLLMRVKTQK